jgi:hypothetical protein
MVTVEHAVQQVHMSHFLLLLRRQNGQHVQAERQPAVGQFCFEIVDLILGSHTLPAIY